ncbi:MAG: hypothetical protein M1118_13990 [Chloroflexi bacterium]|nr:hypothetical protein [Chloroflexota bacterium]
MLTPDSRLWLNPFWQPSTPFEWTVCQLLGRGPAAAGKVIEALAGLTVIEEHQAGTWSLATGEEALPVLRWEVSCALDRLEGSLIVAETSARSRELADQWWLLLPCA